MHIVKRVRPIQSSQGSHKTPKLYHPPVDQTELRRKRSAAHLGADPITKSMS